MRIAIVGAGFSGVATAIQLLHRLPGGSELSLINRTGLFARGMAYGTQSPEHLLNVPAARMDVAPGIAPRFVDWLSEVGMATEPHQFVSRQHYGAYLQACLERASAGRADIRLRLLRDSVEQLERRDGAPSLRIRLQGTHERVAVDRVVLALGHFAPAPPHAALKQLPPHRYVNDPWSDTSFDGLHPNDDLLLVGSGLTALDVLVSLRLRGHRGRITVLSRRGLRPQRHRANETPPAGWTPPSQWLQASEPLRRRLRTLRVMVIEAAQSGLDWRDVWGGLREHTPALWQGLSASQRGQFMRHLQVYWDIHRHRAAPAAYEAFEELLRSGQARLLAGRILDLVEADSGVQLKWRPRGGPSADVRTLTAARIINCAGPSSTIKAESSPLLAQLRQDGLLSPCPQGLGLLVDEQCRALDAHGKPQTDLFYIGPLLKAQHWEATAVPELREHAALLARACASNS